MRCRWQPRGQAGQTATTFVGRRLAISRSLTTYGLVRELQVMGIESVRALSFSTSSSNAAQGKVNACQLCRWIWPLTST